MYCTKCGKEIDDKASFCSFCGEKIEDVSEETVLDSVSENESINETFSGEYINTDPSSSHKSKLPILIAAIVIIAALCGIAYAAPVVKNTLCKAFMSTDKYFAYVHKNSSDSMSEKLCSMTSTAKNQLNMMRASSTNSEIQISDEGKKLIGELMGDYFQYINWIDSVGVHINSNLSNSDVAYSLSAEINKKSIANASAVYSDNKKNMYFSLSDYNKSPIFVDMKNESPGITPFVNLENSFLTVIPDNKVVENLVKRYIAIAVSQIKGVKKLTSRITTESISQKCTQLTAEIDQNTAIRVAKAMLTEAKDDKDIKKIINDSANNINIDGQISYEDFRRGIDDALEDLQEESSDSSGKIIYTAYVNNKGEIFGVSFAADDVNISYICTEDAGRFGMKSEFSNNGLTGGIYGSGKKSGDKYTGEYYISYAGIHIVELKTDKLQMTKNGELSGKITVTPSETLYSLASQLDIDSDIAKSMADYTLIIDADSSFKKAEYGISLQHSGTPLLSFLCKSKANKPSSIKIPDNAIDANDSSEMENWISDFNFDKFVSNLKSANAPSEITDLIQMAAENVR